MDPITLTLFLLGLVLLIGGAELLVRGASGLAGAVGVSPLVIGLTVVALGTSSPELAVSVQASLSGQPDIALGNVIGSNIANVLLILGLSALTAPLAVSRQLVRFDVPMMVAATLLLLVLALDGALGRVDGAVLVAGIVAYTRWMLRSARGGAAEAGVHRGEAAGGRAVVHAGAALLGLVLLVLGSRWLVAGAVQIAGLLGVSELVIGLTVVAVGTSLPEIATSVLAAVRGQRDIAVGNVVGSNLYNILLVLGTAGLSAPEGVGVAEEVLRFDLPVMMAVALICLPIFYSGYQISRWEGALLLAYYGAYTAALIAAARGEAGFPLGLVGVAVAATGAAITMRALWQAHHSGALWPER